jgi:hypothetical protein
MASNQEDRHPSKFSLEAPAHTLDSPIPTPAAFTRWHLLTISLLVLGYSGYYFCRSDLSVVLPLLISDLGQHGIPANVAQVRLGFIASAGVLAYALGKFVSGSLATSSAAATTFLAAWPAQSSSRCSSRSAADSPFSPWLGWATGSFNPRVGWGWSKFPRVALMYIQN